MESKLEIAKRVIKENFKYGDCGLFNNRNTVSEPMCVIYIGNGLLIEICYRYAYFEVFGLSNKEFNELSMYYNELKGRR